MDPYLLANAADIPPEQVLRVLLYQDSKSVPLIWLQKRPSGIVLPCWASVSPRTPLSSPRKRISGREMLGHRCTMAQVGAEQVLALAGGQPMLELVPGWWSTAQWPPMPRQSCALPPRQITLTDAAGGAAVEVLYRMVRAAEKSV